MIGLETTLHLYNIYKFGEVCTDPSLNLLEKLGILIKGRLYNNSTLTVMFFRHVARLCLLECSIVRYSAELDTAVDIIT